MIDFWDVRGAEIERLRQLEVRRDQLQRVIALAHRTIQLEQSSGYTDFVKSVQALHSSVLDKIVSHEGSSRTLWEMKGKASALRDVISVLTKAKTTSGALEAQLRSVENDIEEHVKRTPQKDQP